LSRNGSASADAREEEQIVPSVTAEAPVRQRSGKRRGNSRAVRRQSAIRYFVGKANGSDPVLEQEVASEPEGLVIAFKTDRRLFLIEEFTVAQKIEARRVSLEKQPLPRERVSTANES
jgi:hypothetical protein